MTAILDSTDLTTRFGADELVQLTNLFDPAATVINATVLASAIDDIEALVIAKLAVRYTTPLATVPRVLRNIACDLVRARLYEDRITDHVKDREKAALELLDQIAAGKLSLGLDDAQQATPAIDGPQFTAPARVFSGASLADFNG